MAYSVMYPGANLAQQLIAGEPGSTIDWKQAGRYMVYGGLIHSQIVYRWLHFIGKVFPKRDAAGLSKIVLADQIFFAPVALSSFYVCLTAMEFKSKAEIYAEWEHKFPKTWKVTKTPVILY